LKKSLEPKVQVFVEFIGFVEFIELTQTTQVTQATQVTQVTQVTAARNFFPTILWLEQFKLRMLQVEFIKIRTGGSLSFFKRSVAVVRFRSSAVEN
jgi:hypothetical protein